MWKKKHNELENKLKDYRDLENRITMLVTENERLTEMLNNRQNELDDWKQKYF